MSENQENLQPDAGVVLPDDSGENFTTGTGLPENAFRELGADRIATGGQTVDLRDGVVYVDGVPLDEPYTQGKPSNDLNSGITYPYTVPELSLIHI